ncbi:spindle and kinetochore-associated protein 1 [Brienomyrus brachyistius]|uniref:spindle and kinetochore-associated protein 1 n=1 Tax=Brienomyrus brachyistius TaxID=42636 RepID=UPI0020B3A742|nr:spindle and kinetochore-associated protein 1 [Brienomyrus brachyistius]
MSGELEDLTRHINDKISSIRRVLELRSLAQDADKRKILLKVGQDVLEINGLLDQLEKHIGQQRYMLACLKELEEFFLEDVRDGSHLKDNTPAYMPRKSQPVINGLAPAQSKTSEVQVAPEKDQPRKNTHNPTREMEYITVQEFDSIPPYMRGRVMHGQLNAVVQGINAAVTGKYSILQQSAKTLSSASRKLHQRFKDEETKDTKGHFFVVEADIKEFTQLKVDKRFQGMLNMLRHCQRLRELRGGGLTRYVLL